MFLFNKTSEFYVKAVNILFNKHLVLLSKGNASHATFKSDLITNFSERENSYKIVTFFGFWVNPLVLAAQIRSVYHCCPVKNQISYITLGDDVFSS